MREWHSIVHLSVAVISAGEFVYMLRLSTPTRMRAPIRVRLGLLAGRNARTGSKTSHRYRSRSYLHVRGLRSTAASWAHAGSRQPMKVI